MNRTCMMQLRFFQDFKLDSMSMSSLLGMCIEFCFLYVSSVMLAFLVGYLQYPVCVTVLGATRFTFLFSRLDVIQDSCIISYCNFIVLCFFLLITN